MSKLFNSVKGAALVEYGILVGLIAVAAIGAVSTLGGQVDETFTEVSNKLDSELSDAGIGN